MFVPSSKQLALFIMDQRKKLGLTQAQVGDLVGLRQQTISEFEKNCENSKITTLFSILSAVNLYLDVSPKDQIDTIKTPWKEEW